MLSEPPGSCSPALAPGEEEEAEFLGEKWFSCFKNFFWIPWGVSGSQHASSWKVHTECSPLP